MAWIYNYCIFAVNIVVLQRGVMRTKLFTFLVLFLVIASSSFSSAADNSVVQQGIAQYKAENYEEALVLLLKAKEAAPSSTLAAYYLGLTYKHLERHKEARDQFLAALEQIPPVQDAYTELIETLYILDDLAGAKKWLKIADQTGVKPAHISYLDGLVLMKEGRNEDAVTAFNKAKNLDRTLAQSADFQIALAQIKMRRFDDARKSLQAITAMDPTSDVAAFAQEYERALAKTVEASRKWQITAGLAYQYDDNVISKPTQDIGFDIPGDKGDSSILATLSIVTPSLVSGQWSVNGRYNFYSNTHFSLHTHDIINNTVSVAPSYAFNKGALSFPLSYSHIWLDQQEYLSLLSFRPMLQFALKPGHIIQATAGVSRQDMKKDSIDPDESRDADIYTASAGYIHPFNDNRNLFNLIYEFTKQDTEGRNWENNGHRISAGLLLPFFRNDLNLILSGDALLQDYDNIHTIFDKKRKDRIYTGSANLRWEMNKKISMNLQYSHTTADSNIRNYDYKRNIVTAGMELRF